MRIPLAVLALAAAAASASAQSPPAPAYGEAVFVVSGRGWGHGVGMSQYGAYGQAVEGRSYDEILTYYYSGTSIGRARTKDVRVLLAEGRRAVTVSSAAPYSAVDAAGATYRLPKGPLTLRKELRLPAEGGLVQATPPLVVRPGKNAVLTLDGRPYRGRLELTVDKGFLRVINVVGLEPYLSGVVPGEVPHAWPTEALKAQAVAARSYALATVVKGKPFDLYSDVRSQVYLGVAGEKARTTEAVEATAGEVLLYGGRIATTYYFSTSGGKTASAADVFGFDVPYLRSRPDPWDRASPYHRWGPVLLGARTMQAKLGLDARVVDATATATPSGRIRSLAVQTTGGSEVVPASLVRTALGLRSTWITVGVLRLDRPPGTLLFGSSTRLAGVSRGVASARLASSVDGVAWTEVGTPARDATGAVSVDVKPLRSTRYRLQGAEAASPPQLVQVAPRVQLSPPNALEPTVLPGSVRPRLAGLTVTIERRRGQAWVEVATAVTDAGGRFRAELELASGSYRARVPAAAGLAAGVSEVVQVTR